MAVGRFWNLNGDFVFVSRLPGALVDRGRRQNPLGDQTCAASGFYLRRDPFSNDEFLNFSGLAHLAHAQQKSKGIGDCIKIMATQTRFDLNAANFSEQNFAPKDAIPYQVIF